MTESPFIFSPWLERTEDLLGVYDTQQGVEPASFVVSSTGPQFFAAQLTVEFSARPRPPAMDPSLLSSLRARQRFPLANLIPESITPAFRQHSAVRYLHAPSEIVWKLSDGKRT